jgi:hypothetical protein
MGKKHTAYPDNRSKQMERQRKGHGYLLIK